MEPEFPRSDDGLGERDDRHGAGGKDDQYPVGQEAVRRMHVAVTMFVSHVNSGNPFGPRGAILLARS